jgi:hypothetical protein
VGIASFFGPVPAFPSVFPPAYRLKTGTNIIFLDSSKSMFYLLIPSFGFPEKGTIMKGIQLFWKCTLDAIKGSMRENNCP